MNPTALLHEDDFVLIVPATQEARHAAILRANEIARATVERSRASAAAAKPDADGALPDPMALRIVIGLDRETLTVKQRRFLHGVVFPQIAEQVTMPDGARFAAPVWKEYFRARFLGFRWECVRYPGQKRATPRRVRVSTEDLSVKQYSQHIDKVIDHAVTEYGVRFDFVEGERDAVRYVKPSRRAVPA